MNKAEYAEYLQSEHWKEIRRRRLDFDGYRCTKCKSSFSLQVHHNLYRQNLLDTILSDLSTLCRHCHTKEHGLPTDNVPHLMSRADKEALINEMDRLGHYPKQTYRHPHPNRDRKAQLPLGMTERKFKQHARLACILLCVRTKSFVGLTVLNHINRAYDAYRHACLSPQPQWLVRNTLKNTGDHNKEVRAISGSMALQRDCSTTSLATLVPKVV